MPLSNDRNSLDPKTSELEIFTFFSKFSALKAPQPTICWTVARQKGHLRVEVSADEEITRGRENKSEIKAANTTYRYVNVLWQHCMQHVATSCCAIVSSLLLQLLVYESLSCTISKCGFLLHSVRRDLVSAAR